MNKQRNCSIDLFRYLCAIMVVIIHSSFWRSWGEIGFFIGNVFVRIAVPFFFAVSGYFYIKGLESGKKVFWKQIKHLLIIYTLWTLIHYVCELIYYKPFGNIVSFTVDRMIAFVFVGSTGHFWFFPAIIIATCLVTLFYKAKISKALLPVSIVLYAIGCLGCSYFGLGVKIPLLGWLFRHPSFEAIRRIFLMGFPFFACGQLVLKLESKNVKSLSLLWLGAAVLFVAEIYLVTCLKLASNVFINRRLVHFIALYASSAAKAPSATVRKGRRIFKNHCQFHLLFASSSDGLLFKARSWHFGSSCVFLNTYQHLCYWLCLPYFGGEKEFENYQILHWLNHKCRFAESFLAIRHFLYRNFDIMFPKIGKDILDERCGR